jgi:hypothetical protein
MFNPRKRSKRVTVCAAIALYLGLPLNALKQISKALEIVKTIVVLANFCYNKGIVFVAVQQFVLGMVFNILPPNYVSMENSAVDAFGVVFIN